MLKQLKNNPYCLPSHQKQTYFLSLLLTFYIGKLNNMKIKY